MKKIAIIVLVLVTLSTYSSVHGDSIQDQITITVTSDKKTTFDMFDSTKGMLKGLTTPYEMKFARTDSRFIFKSQKSKTDLKIKVELDDQTVVTADWPITVLVVTNSSVETFGME
jgi:hypothetical protein